MELVGKIVRREIKDFGKGKDAEADEVLICTAKLDGGNSGVRGILTFARGEHAHEYDLGDHISVHVEQRQGKLELAGGEDE